LSAWRDGFRFAARGAAAFAPGVIPAAKVLPQALIASPERRQEADADREIVLRVQAGEVAAFDALVLRYRERVYGVIYNLIGNREDAADLTQDCFIKAFRSIHRFQAQAAFFTWLYRIAVNSTGHLCPRAAGKIERRAAKIVYQASHRGDPLRN
jgi:hypothetical protein